MMKFFILVEISYVLHCSCDTQNHPVLILYCPCFLWVE